MNITTYSGVSSPGTFHKMLDEISRTRKERHHRIGQHDIGLWKTVVQQHLPSYRAVCGDEAIGFIFSLCKHSEAGCSNIQLPRYPIAEYLLSANFVVIQNKRIPEFYICLYTPQYKALMSSMGKMQMFQRFNLDQIIKVNFTPVEWSMYMLLHGDNNKPSKAGEVALESFYSVHAKELEHEEKEEKVLAA